MRRVQYFFLLFGLFILFSFHGYAQLNGVDPITWTTRVEKQSDSLVNLIFKAKIEPQWHIYSVDLPKGGPNPTTFEFTPSERFALEGKMREVGTLIKSFDEAFGIELLMYGDSVEFVQPVLCRTEEPFNVEVHVDYQMCFETQCNYFEKDFSLQVPVRSEMAAVQGMKPFQPLVKIESDASASTESQPVESSDDFASKGLLVFFFLSFFAGLAGLLTPCVFPMIPMTVSFFLAKKNRMNALINAIIFGVSIVVIYTLLGLLVSLTSMGADFVSDVTSHWITNSIFFLLFIVFAAAFFGMFEIRMPGSLTSKADAKVDKGGFIGSFFFALTTVIVSLSCVGPIVGALLVEAASGESVKPILGMFAFSLGFSLPFTFFAIFPSLLNKLPKSGGWLNSVKIVLGFIVLAFSLKFLLNIDVAFHLGWLSRSLFLSIWIVLSGLLGLYLLGYLRFKMDSKLEHVGFFRMLLAGAAFTFALVLIPGLFGAPLTKLSGFLPESSPESAWSLGAVGASSVSQSENYPGLCETPRFADFLSMPAGLEGYRDYKQGLNCAKQQNKPLLVDFSGHGCANCKEMAAKVLANPSVNRFIRENFILTTLYVDDRTTLPEEEWYTSSVDGRVKKTIGKQNLDLQLSRFNSSGLPTFVVVSPSEKILAGPKGRDLDPDSFLKFLEEAHREFLAQ